jgi:hypothetical protein
VPLHTDACSFHQLRPYLLAPLPFFCHCSCCFPASAGSTARVPTLVRALWRTAAADLRSSSNPTPALQGAEAALHPCVPPAAAQQASYTRAAGSTGRGWWGSWSNTAAGQARPAAGSECAAVGGRCKHACCGGYTGAGGCCELALGCVHCWWCLCDCIGAVMLLQLVQFPWWVMGWATLCCLYNLFSFKYFGACQSAAVCMQLLHAHALCQQRDRVCFDCSHCFYVEVS